MQAIVLREYGDPSAFRIETMEKPTPKESEVLIRVRAAAVNDYDWCMMRGKPYLYRLMFGLTKPKKQILGMELAGTVESVGANSPRFKIGDAVFGDISESGFGAFAEYVCVNECALELMPKQMSFEEAASIPHAATLAMQGLIDVGEIQEKQKVLINGAGGGVGVFGLQIAKRYNAEVTGVDTGEKLEMMRSIGFDHVIDYKTEDFTKNGQLYDLILDAKTSRSAFTHLRALSSQGRYLTVGGNLEWLLQTVVLKPWISWFGKKSVHIVALKANKDLAFVGELCEKGELKPVIDGPHKLSDVPELIQYFGEGKHVGKIVVTVQE